MHSMFCTLNEINRKFISHFSGHSHFSEVIKAINNIVAPARNAQPVLNIYQHLGEK